MYEIEVTLTLRVDFNSVYPLGRGAYEYEYTVEIPTQDELKDAIKQQALEVLEDCVIDFANGGD